MKRINKQWWSGKDGYYKETAKHTYEGPFETMDTKEEPIVDSGEILAVLANKKVDNEE